MVCWTSIRVAGHHRRRHAPTCVICTRIFCRLDTSACCGPDAGFALKRRATPSAVSQHREMRLCKQSSMRCLSWQHRCCRVGTERTPSRCPSNSSNSSALRSNRHESSRVVHLARVYIPDELGTTAEGCSEAEITIAIASCHGRLTIEAGESPGKVLLHQRVKGRDEHTTLRLPDGPTRPYGQALVKQWR
jgi:hypothetical protein